jgi:hypothetical protein
MTPPDSYDCLVMNTKGSRDFQVVNTPVIHDALINLALESLFVTSFGQHPSGEYATESRLALVVPGGEYTKESITNTNKSTNI